MTRLPTTENNGPTVGAAALACVSAAFIFLMHPRLGIRDIDGYSYIMGARSLRQGAGYRSLTGEALNHWPPGYSLLLSPFPDPVLAALVLNYLSFGATIGLLYYLLRRSSWTWQAALGFSVTLGSGFFRMLANEAHADILAYALFFSAICLAVQKPARTMSAIIWAVLVPIKLIAVVFLPPAVVADIATRRHDWKSVARSYVPGAIVTAISIGGIFVFNVLTVRTLIPASHAESSLAVLVEGARSFATSIPRIFLFDWHGTVRAPFPRIAFPACMLLAVVCLSSLRPTSDGRWQRIYGGSCLACSALLLCVRSFDPTVRLVGYGLIVLALGFRPKKWANLVWLSYGALSLTIGITNALTVNSLGDNDPRYAQLAAEFRSYYTSSDIVATNSFHILDLYAGIPSTPISDYADADRYKNFFWVTLPQFDAVAESVTPMPYPGKEWCEQRQFSGGVLFMRCAP
jgi:hypothetical protein